MMDLDHHMYFHPEFISEFAPDMRHATVVTDELQITRDYDQTSHTKLLLSHGYAQIN